MGADKPPALGKGTGRRGSGEIRNPLWRKGGTVFGPQPRNYDYALPRKVEVGAMRAALAPGVNEAPGVVEAPRKAQDQNDRRDVAPAGRDRQALDTASSRTTVALTSRNIAGMRLVTRRRP